jgi:hypothetical protein
MTYVRSFEGYTPPPRYDVGADPFTKAKIEEAEAADGTFLVIGEVTLSPVDTDPANPAERSFTVDTAQFNPGFYRIAWVDAAGSQDLGAVQKFPSLPPWAPSRRDVGRHVRSRTLEKGGLGVEAGTFNENTRPTGAEVDGFIADACRRVKSSIDGEPCSEELSEDATNAAALYAALLVETSLGGQSTSPGMFDNLEKLWKDAIKSLAGAIARECGKGEGEEEGGGEGGHALPAGGFDDGRQILGPNYPESPRSGAAGRAEGAEFPWGRTGGDGW